MAMARFNLACSARFNGAAHLAADGQVHEQHPGAASLADEDHVGSGHQTEPGPAHRPIVLLLGGQMVDPLGEVVEEIQGLGGVPRDGLPDPHDQQGQDGLHPPPRNPRQVRGGSKTPWGSRARQPRTWLNFRGTPSGSSCRIVHSRRTYRGTSASTWETGSRSPRRMSTPGRSDTWCAPSGTRFSRSSRPCSSRQEGLSESTSDMRTGMKRWSARPHRRPCSKKSRTHRPRMPAGM